MTRNNAVSKEYNLVQVINNLTAVYKIHQPIYEDKNKSKIRCETGKMSTMEQGYVKTEHFTDGLMKLYFSKKYLELIIRRSKQPYQIFIISYIESTNTL